MYGKIVMGLAFLAVAGTLSGGCKKETAEKPATPAQAPAPLPPPPAEARTGEELYRQYCAVCHPDGGNTINPKKTLQQKVREANGIETAEDIIMKIRVPGPGMNKFDQNTISDEEAKALAEYVLKTFR